MSLQVWLPFTKDLSNQGLLDLPSTSRNTMTVVDAGKLGKCYKGNIGWHLPSEILGNTWSVATWYKASDFGQYNNIIFCKNLNTSEDYQIYLSIISNNTYRLGVNGSWGLTITYNFELDVWYHLVGTYDGSTISLYANGVLVGSLAYSSTQTTGAVNIQINGRATDTAGTGTTGNNTSYYNDFRLYNHCLTAKEVKELSKGLVAHYTLGDSYLEGTTNLVTTSDCLSSTCYNGAKGTYGYGTNTDMYKTTGIFNGKFGTKLYMGTSGASARPYPYTANIFVSNGTNQPEYKTISFDYYGTIGTYINPYKLGSGNATCNWTNNATATKSGSFTNSGNIPVMPNMWNHIVMTLHGTTDANAEWGYIILGDTHTSDTSNYWLFANMQIETKDHATGYAGVGGTRNNTTVYDSSGYNYHGTINTAMSVSNNTSRYSVSTVFDGASNAIKIPFNTMLGLTTAGKVDYTISVWTYKTAIGSKGYQTILGGPSGFELEARNAAETTPTYVAWNWGKNTGTYEFSKWTLFTFVHTSSDNKIYVNGELASSGSSTNVPIGDFFIGSWRDVSSQNYQGQMSDFRIYATALSADDIKELYQTSASIDKSGNMYAYELREV